MYILIIILTFSGCIKGDSYKTIHLFMMDTLIEITLPKEHEQEFKSVELIMQRLTNLVSANSYEISTNKNAVPIDRFVYNLLEDESRYFKLSGGRFNATIITVSSLYGFPDKPKSIPDIEKLDEVLKVSLGGRVEYWKGNGRYFAKGNGLKIDLSAFAKGAIVDEAVAYLKSKGVDSFVINAGGDLYAAGRKYGKSWRVGVADPKSRKQIIEAIDISDGGVATSGVNERYFISDKGLHISHIFDGVTGEPTNRYQSITVVADTVKEADAFSTIYFLMDIKEVKNSCLENRHIVYVVHNSQEKDTYNCR